MNAELRTRAILIAMLLAAWAGLIYAKSALPAFVLPDVNSLISYIQVLLGGIVGYHVGSSGPQPAPAAPAAPHADTGQGGFAAVPFVALLAVIALAMLAGCTTTTASMYSGIYTQAKAGVQVFDDNALVTMKDLVCAQPYSAIQRHPELQPGILALCGPMTNTATLDPAQVMQMLSIAKQLGLAPAAPAAAAPAAK